LEEREEEDGEGISILCMYRGRRAETTWGKTRYVALDIRRALIIHVEIDKVR